MIFISAQPDDSYFIWQLELQIKNLGNLGIGKEEIHILVGFNSKIGLNPFFRKFIEENETLANFYSYEDLRIKPQYLSSIRPNILYQHFLKFPELSEKTLFYYDSDVLFSRIPNIENVESNDTCYVSDTRSYLDANYIRRVGCEDLLDKMLDIVGLTKRKLEEEDLNTGGAQYILKGITANFWKKIEYDSESLYVLMLEYNKDVWGKRYKVEKELRSTFQGIQAWCADMWAVLWNLWLLDKKVEIHFEMSFSWPDSPIENWEKFSMLHYSGNMDSNKQIFRKINYMNFMPWYDESLMDIPKSSCSCKIVQAINRKKEELDMRRSKFESKGILLQVDIIDKSKYETFKINKKYIEKYFNIDVFLLYNEICDEIEESSCFLKKDNILENSLLLNKYLLSFVVIPVHQILRVEQWLSILGFECKNCLFRSDFGYRLDNLFNVAFSKILDISLLDENLGKFNKVPISESIFVFDRSNLMRHLLGGSFVIETRSESLNPYLLIV